MSKYKALIFDLDGTAIPNVAHAMPSQSVIDAVANASEHLILCAATGRPITNAAPILEALNLKHPCVISAGTQIVDPTTRKILWEATISNDDLHQILDILHEYHYEVLINNELRGEGGRASSRDRSTHLNVLYVMGVSKADGEAILAKLTMVDGITASGVISWTDEGIDIHITAKDATKEHAVAELLKMIGVSKEHTIGVGDADNDVHLFEAVGHKIAMGNATNRLKSLADEIAPTVDKDGLAVVIHKFSRID